MTSQNFQSWLAGLDLLSEAQWPQLHAAARERCEGSAALAAIELQVKSARLRLDCITINAGWRRGARWWREPDPLRIFCWRFRTLSSSTSDCVVVRLLRDSRLDHLLPCSRGAGSLEPGAVFISILFTQNLLLMTIHLLRFPPLDGNTVPSLFLSEQRARKWFDPSRDSAFGFLGLFAVWSLFGSLFWPMLHFAVDRP